MPRSRSDTAPRVDLRAARAALPRIFGDVVDRFERHLAAERGLSAHTVRAYVGDVVSLLADVVAAEGQEAEPTAVTHDNQRP